MMNFCAPIISRNLLYLAQISGVEILLLFSNIGKRWRSQMEKNKVYSRLAFSLIILLGVLFFRFVFFFRNSPEPYIRQAKITGDSWCSHYVVRDDSLPLESLMDSTRTNVFILVDSWGVPLDSFRRIRMDGIRMQRLSRSSFAENVHLRGLVGRAHQWSVPAAFLYGGSDSLYGRGEYIHAMGFDSVRFYKKDEPDSLMLACLDSLISVPGMRFVAWTARGLRDHLRNGDDYFMALDAELRMLADFAAKHRNVRFIIQGNHEPVLCSRDVRDLFYRRCVPFAVLN